MYCTFHRKAAKEEAPNAFARDVTSAIRSFSGIASGRFICYIAPGPSPQAHLVVGDLKRLGFSTYIQDGYSLFMRRPVTSTSVYGNNFLTLKLVST